MKVVSVKTPRWNNKQDGIIATVRFEELKRDIEFCAMPDDVEEYGRALFKRLLSGEFGKIADATPPPRVDLNVEKVRIMEMIGRGDDASRELCRKAFAATTIEELHALMGGGT